MLQFKCQLWFSWVTWSRGRGIATGSLCSPAARLVCSSLFLAAGGAVMAGLAPAGRDPMLQVSLGRMEFIYLYVSALVSGS